MWAFVEFNFPLRDVQDNGALGLYNIVIGEHFKVVLKIIHIIKCFAALNGRA